jgi:hypothetical protein
MSSKLSKISKIRADERDRIMALPFFAITKGIAQGNEGYRVGVYGFSVSNVGVYAESDKNIGLFATGGTFAASFDGNVEVAGGLTVQENKTKFNAVVAKSHSGAGVWATSDTYEAVHAETNSHIAAIAAYNLSHGDGFALYGKKEGGGQAGFFDGDVWIRDTLGVGVDIKLANGQDCAEDFDISEEEPIEPGDVMVLGKEGMLQPSYQAYDKRVAGVISGAGDYKPGIVLDKKQSQKNRKPVAMVGKVFCKVDASYAGIEVGDLLTTSPTRGHAMKADDPIKAFGAIIGKAIGQLEKGCGLIPILVGLL